MDVNQNMHQSDTITIGEDLYGHSLNELENRIAALKAEIIRVDAELTKKRTERDAADSVFKSKD